MTPEEWHQKTLGKIDRLMSKGVRGSADVNRLHALASAVQAYERIGTQEEMKREDKARKLAAELLDEYADRLGNDVCNDWEWPSNWTAKDRFEFTRLFISYNEHRTLDTVTDDQVRDQGPYLHNYCVAGLLAHMLRTERI